MTASIYKGYMSQHDLHELTMVNIALLSLLMWSNKLMTVLYNLNCKTKDSYLSNIAETERQWFD